MAKTAVEVGTMKFGAEVGINSRKRLGACTEHWQPRFSTMDPFNRGFAAADH